MSADVVEPFGASGGSGSARDDGGSGGGGGTGWAHSFSIEDAEVELERVRERALLVENFDGARYVGSVLSSVSQTSAYYDTLGDGTAPGGETREQAVRRLCAQVDAFAHDPSTPIPPESADALAQHYAATARRQPGAGEGPPVLPGLPPPLRASSLYAAGGELSAALRKQQQQQQAATGAADAAAFLHTVGAEADGLAAELVVQLEADDAAEEEAAAAAEMEAEDTRQIALLQEQLREQQQQQQQHTTVSDEVEPFDDEGPEGGVRGSPGTGGAAHRAGGEEEEEEAGRSFQKPPAVALGQSVAQGAGAGDDADDDTECIDLSQIPGTIPEQGKACDNEAAGVDEEVKRETPNDTEGGVDPHRQDEDSGCCCTVM